MATLQCGRVSPLACVSSHDCPVASRALKRGGPPAVGVKAGSFSGVAMPRGARRSSHAGVVRMSLRKPLVPEEFLSENLNEQQLQNYESLPALLGGSSRGKPFAVCEPMPAVVQEPKMMLDGLEVPSSLYGLTPKQIRMFGLDASEPNFRPPTIDPEHLSAKYAIRNSLVPNNFSKVTSMSYGGVGPRGGGPNSAGPPPDLPSLLLNSRILYIGMPLVPAVTELLVAQLLWLQYDNRDKPIYVYINSPGTQNDEKQSLGFETEATAVADSLLLSWTPRASTRLRAPWPTWSSRPTSWRTTRSTWSTSSRTRPGATHAMCATSSPSAAT
eukprot:jgi/Mesvir1/26887/Mv20620-RA.2